MRSTFSMLWRRALIIGAALALLGGCSTVRLGYNQGPQLAWWWIDGYLDFNAEQAPRVREALAQWFAWHRQTQLTDYASALARARVEADADVTPAQVCRWSEDLRERIEPALDRVLPTAAEIALTLTPAQLARLDKRLAQSNDTFRKDQLQPGLAERRQAAADRTIERFESFYGPLDEAQRRLVADAVASSPYDPQAWLSERGSRQRELVATLRGIVAEKPEAANAQARLRALAKRFDGSPQGPMRAARLALAQHQCELVARLHNGASVVQRQMLRKKLGGWEGDLRQLAGDIAAPPAPVRLGSR